MGLIIDSNLSWKKQVECVLKKVRRGIGILSKIRHYITKDILKSLYYTLIYPFLIYGLIAWGNTYNTTLQPFYSLQKKAFRGIIYSSFDHYRNPLFKLLGIIIFPDLVKYHIGVFMNKYHNQLLPSVFNSFFTKVDQVHSYNTRHSSKLSHYLPKLRINYGKFNIRFPGPMIWIIGFYQLG